MASAARAYQAQPRYGNSYQPSIRVYPGQKKQKQTSMILIFSAFIAAVLAIFLFCVVRIWFTNASMSMLLETNDVETEITNARQAGSELELQYYAITDPAKVKSYATKNLGMGSISGDITYVDLTPAYIVNAVNTLVEDVAPTCLAMESRSKSPELVSAYAGSIMPQEDADVGESSGSPAQPLESTEGEATAQ